MRLNINLATHPYQDLNRFLRRWAVPLAVFVVASIALIGWTWHQYSAGRGMNQKIKAQQEQIKAFDLQKANVTKMLSEPANKEVADTARFLNTMIAKKAFSWTRVFMQMEEIMPGRLHVVSLSPDLTANNQLQLTMRVAGDSRDQAVELVRRIEKSPSFRNPLLKSETMLPPDQIKEGDSVLFEISAVYVPTLAPSAKPVTDKAAAAAESTTQNDTPAKPSETPKSKGAKP
jgi:type IV pilus assembly protein PilN